MDKVYRITTILIIATLFISGCASVPQQVLIVNKNSGQTNSREFSNCEADKLYRTNIEAFSSLQTLNADNISILSWNIHKEQRDNWSTDFIKLSTDSSIIVLQEALLNPQMHDLLGDKKLYWDLNTAFYQDTNETGVMTASTTKPVYTCGLRITEPMIRTPKTTLISRFQLSDSDEHLLVANIHGINFSLGTKAYTEQMTALTNTLVDHDGPIIIAGDFNNWNDARMSIVNEMTSILELKTVSYEDTNRVTIFGNTIDHIYYRNLDIISQDTIKVTSSDHNPIKVTFKTSDKKLARQMQ